MTNAALGAFNTVESDFTIYYFQTIQASLTRTNITVEHLRDYYSHASKTAIQLFSLAI